DFHVGELAGKIATYSVKVQEVRERVLPELDEQFLQAQGVSSVEELRSKVEESLKGRKEAEDRANRRRQVMEELSRRVDFPIPESLIDSEADQLVHQIVEQNIRQGIPQEELEKNKDEIFATARKNAIERVKVRMLLLRIAEKEEIKLERDDMNRAIVMEAMRARQKPEKFVKELEKNRDRLRAIQQDVLIDKALDFLVEQATVSASS
ncbi:MAG: trigger factor, partial [Verrucomicrobia bacterium]